MISELTADGLGEDYVLRRLDRLVVKGKTEPITVFEVVGRRGEVEGDDPGAAGAVRPGAGLA